MSLIVPDSFDKLFVRCDGDGSSFVDSSTENTKTITANGNATQLKTPEDFEGKRTAMFFNGTTDSVLVADSDDWTASTDWEISCYVFFNATGTQVIAGQYSGTNHGFYLVRTDTYFEYGVSYDGTNFVAGRKTMVPAINTWYHIKGTKTATQIKIFVDDVEGELVGDFTGKTAYNSTIPLTIGMLTGVGQYVNGWLKNLTIVKGTTTVLNMLADSPANSPLAPAIAFDGTGDYLDLADSADWDFGNGAFTLEAWINVPNVSGTKVIFSRNGYVDYALYLADAQLDYQSDNGNYGIQNGGTITANRWNHIALVRESTSAGATKIYINGVNTSSGNTTSNIASSAILRIGARSSDANSPFTGSMREIRISNVARYTSAFTPSQTGFSVDANTVLYIKGNEDNGVTTFVDSSTTPKTVTTAGDTKIKYTEDYRSCIFKDETGKFPYPVGSAKVDFFSAFGSGVGYFDGTGDYLSVPNSADWAFGAGNFTLECFVRFSSLVNTQGLFNQYKAPAWQDQWNFSKADSTNKLTYSSLTGGVGKASYAMSSNWSVNVNQWYHVSAVRNGATLLIFINGESQSLTETTAFGANENAVVVDVIKIGLYEHGVNGLLDNIRISKGIARYTATFNPPVDVADPVSVTKINFLGMF